jgi:hypothetical protein
MDLLKLFCDVDDFVKGLEKGNCSKISYTSKPPSDRPKVSKRRMALSEIMTILIAYHSSNFKNFKSFYFSLLMGTRKDFPNLLSYTRFLDWVPYCLIPLAHYLNSRKGEVTGINFIDSTKIQVCKNMRINRNKTFSGIASRGKSTMGWFFGFKLHIVGNDRGELLAFHLSKGNLDDRAPVKTLCKNLKGKLFGDKGYLSAKLFAELWHQGLQLITGIRDNMKNKFLPIQDKILLRKRFVIETINDQLKNISDVEHSRHRSPINFLVNIICGLISCQEQHCIPNFR